MNIFIKPAIKLGAILGAIFGLVFLIPFLNCLGCFTISMVGAAVVYYLKRNSLIGILSLQDGAFIGALSGFAALITSSVVFLPLSAILGKIFSPLAKAGFNLTSSFLAASYSFLVIIMLVFFIALLSALFNAFSGLIVAYIYERIESKPVSEEDVFVLEQ